MQRLFVFVFANAGIPTIIPAVNAADQVLPGNLAVRQQSPAVKAAAIEYRNLAAEPHDHEVHIGDQRVGRFAVFELTPSGDFDLLTSDSIGS